MKVVLFCGGMGTRLRDYSESIPKPLVPVGTRPVMWNLMRYYAHYGHKDFIVCLGYKGDKIKDYFLNYDECVSNDFVLEGAGSSEQKVELLRSDIHDWRITFVDTGLQANIGQRLMAVRDHLKGEKMFLANYSDGLSDLPLDRYVADFEASGKTASFVSVPVPHTFHIVESNGRAVERLVAVSESDIRINGGYFAFRQEIFEHMREGEELVFAPFERLIAKNELLAHRHDGFWRSMDTFRDKQSLDELCDAGKAPWEVWRR